MRPNQLDRIIRLVRRTGDRFVILDKESDQTMVLMNLDEYENLLSSTSSLEDLDEEDMLNKLNHDISRWQDKKKVQQTSPVWEEEKKEPLPIVEVNSDISEALETDEEIDEFEPLEDDEFKDLDIVPEIEPSVVSEPVLEPMLEKTFEPSPIPLETASIEPVFAEESLSNLPDGEEEKFYLEPIE